MPSVPTARYVDVLAQPNVLVTFSASLLGRSAYAIVLLPLLYAAQSASGSVAVAGAVVGCYGAGASLLAPARAWVIDRYGARRALLWFIAAFSTTLATIAVASLQSPSAPLLIALGAVLGAMAPPLGPTMRVAWGTLAPAPPLLRKAMSLDTVTEEVLYLTGPALAGLLLAGTSPSVALIVPAAAALIGGTAFALSPTVGAMRGSGGGRRVEHRPRTTRTAAPLRNPNFIGVLLRVLVGGGIAGALTITVPSLLAEKGPGTVGIALACFAGGSAVGGMFYGALKFSGGAGTQSLALAGALVLLSAPIALRTDVAWVCAVLFVAGLCFSPLMIVAYLSAHAEGGARHQNAATTWVNTAHNLGSAAASALTGWSMQAMSAPAAVTSTHLTAATILVASVLVPLIGRGRGGDRSHTRE